MRIVDLPSWCIALVLVSAIPAHAQSPFAVRVTGGPGTVGAWRENAASTGDFGGIAAIDLLWGARPGHAWVLSGEAAGTMASTMELQDWPQRPHVHSAAHWSILLGRERHAGAGSGFFAHAGLGIGRTMAEVSGGIDSDVAGVALGLAAGERWVPAPGPLGFVIAARTSHVISSSARSHALALVVGLTIQPLPAAEPVLASFGSHRSACRAP